MGSEMCIRDRFQASIMPAGMNGSKKENGAAWTQMSEEELSGRMKKAAQKLAEFIANDLSLDDSNIALELKTADPEQKSEPKTEPEYSILSESDPDS